MVGRFDLVIGGLAEYLDFKLSKFNPETTQIYPLIKLPKKQKTSPQVIQGEAAQLHSTTKYSLIAVGVEI